jgi:hypothetical protein
MSMHTLHSAAGLTIALAASAFAQTGYEAVVISPGFVIEGQVVKGVPYSAHAVTSVKQTLPTGSEISTQVTALVARDAEGRTRREQNLNAIGPWAIGRSREEPRSESLTVILIQDPVKQVNYTLDPRTHLARMGRQRTTSEMEAARARENANRGEEPRREPTRAERVEALGERTIEGVKGQGRRVVTTIPAGSIGNNAPIEIVVETWYSPELQVVVLGKRSDPRVGDMTYKLIGIKRGEPPASLFEVPAGYRIEGEREPRKEE